MTHVVRDQPDQLTDAERDCLLRLARASIEAAAQGHPPPSVNLDELPERLRQPAACFVTLHWHGQLRGCTGVLAARAPLAQEVVETAKRTALSDPRFAPVEAWELPDLTIEISVLSEPQPLDVPRPQDLPRLLHPGVDGVVLQRGPYRATFLPQVWKRIPDPHEFLGMLCRKMGLHPLAWLEPGMEVSIYHVEEFAEPGFEDEDEGDD
ncbi:MAG: hypothetical protein Kow00124_05390 [Anaerolineae bacterium]